MKMTGEHVIAAPRDRVWAALNDPDLLRRSLDGCEALDKTSDTTFTAKVVARIGPVKAAFSGKVTLSDVDPPNGYSINGEGTGGVGFAKGGAQVSLLEEGGSTRLRYTVNAEVGGKLAQIGSRLVDGAARKTADDFFSRFAELVAAPESSASGGPVASAAATSASSSPFVVEVDLRWIGVAFAMAASLGAGFIWGRSSRPR